MTLPIILLVLAVVLVMLELVLPSFGLLSLGAASAYAFALVLAFRLGVSTGWTFVSAGVVLFPLAVGFGFKVLPNTPLGRKLFLSPPHPTSETSEPGSSSPVRVGSHGVALTDLRPSGSAKIGNQRVDVVAGGRFVPRGTAIAVREIEGARVVVLPIEP